MPLLERVRVEVYVPDLPAASYRNLLLSFEEEFTYAFGGCTIARGLDGNYLSQAGVKIPDRINLIYTDLTLALSTNFESVARYADELKQAAREALSEEDDEKIKITNSNVHRRICCRTKRRTGLDDLESR